MNFEVYFIVALVHTKIEDQRNHFIFEENARIPKKQVMQQNAMNSKRHDATLLFKTSFVTDPTATLARLLSTCGSYIFLLQYIPQSKRKCWVCLGLHCSEFTSSFEITVKLLFFLGTLEEMGRQWYKCENCWRQFLPVIPRGPEALRREENR